MRVIAPQAEIDPDCFWNDELNVGIPIVDTQHRAITTLAARIARDPDAALNSEQCVDILTDFQQLTAEHFDPEERVIQGVAVRESAKQAKIEGRSILLEKIASLTLDKTFHKGPKYVAELMAALGEMIIGHVVKYDFMLKASSR